MNTHDTSFVAGTTLVDTVIQQNGIFHTKYTFHATTLVSSWPQSRKWPPVKICGAQKSPCVIFRFCTIIVAQSMKITWEIPCTTASRANTAMYAMHQTWIFSMTEESTDVNNKGIPSFVRHIYSCLLYASVEQACEPVPSSMPRIQKTHKSLSCTQKHVLLTSVAKIMGNRRWRLYC